jgi:hypothetical protein
MPASRARRSRLDPTLVVFVVGVVLASLYAARPAPVTESVDSGRPSPWTRVLDWARVAGAPFAGGVGLMVVGAWLGRARRRRRLTSSSRREELTATADAVSTGREVDPIELASTLLARSADRLEQLRDAQLEPEVWAGRAQLDELLEHDVPAVLELGTALAAQLGAVRYAEFMGAYAGCERNAARAWSALTDEALDEVPPSLERATTSLALARSYLGQEARDGARVDGGASSEADRD